MPQGTVPFLFYIAPFKPFVWLGMLVTLLSIISMLCAFLHWCGNSQISFTPLLFLLATIFEECPSIPREIAGLPFVRYILGTWLIMSVILTNCYNGMLTTELNAPLPILPLQTFDDLICEQTRHDTDVYFNRSITHECRILSQTIALLHGTKLQGSPYCERKIKLYIVKIVNDASIMDKLIAGLQISKDCFTILSLPEKITLGIQMVPTFLDFLVQVNVWRLANLPSYVWLEFEFLPKHYISKRFYKSKQILYLGMEGIIFTGAGASTVQRSYLSLFESGILKRLQHEWIVKGWRGRTPVLGFKRGLGHDSVSLSGSFGTIFILCGCTCLLALIVWFCEIWRLVCSRCLFTARFAYYKLIRVILYLKSLSWGG